MRTRLNQSTPPVHSAEYLERRWFLDGSAVSVAESSQDQRPNRIEVVELSLADDESSDAKVKPSELPRDVAASLAKQFSNADLIDASFSTDDGPEYAINAKVQGKLLELTFTPDGQLIEIGKPIQSNELPQSVVVWLKDNFPGAHVDDAAFVTKGNSSDYELLIGTADRQYDATVRVEDADARTLAKSSPSVANASHEDELSHQRLPQEDPSNEFRLLKDDVEQTQTSPHPPQQVASSKNAAAEHESEPSDSRAASRIKSIGVPNGAPLTFNPDDKIAQQRLGVVPIMPIPQLGEMLKAGVTIGADKLQAEFRETMALLALSSKRTLVRHVSGPGAFGIGLVVSGMIAAGNFVLRRSQKSKRPLLTTVNRYQDGWSWIIGTSVTKRI